MRTYSFVKLVVDGNTTANLDIYTEGNIFSIFEYDMNAFSGSWTGAMKFIESWKAKNQNIVDFLKANGHEVKFEQNIH